jgi:hypothetical protein
MDECVKSGYTLATADKKVLKLDAKGNQLALDLIKKTDRDKDSTVAVMAPSLVTRSPSQASSCSRLQRVEDRGDLGPRISRCARATVLRRSPCRT